MKQLVLASLIAVAASQAAGCIITSGDDDGGESAFISATWQLRSEATGQTATCPPGFDTAALYNRPVDANGNFIGEAYIDLFDCPAGAGTSAPLPPGLYLTWLEIANNNNTQVYAQSLSAYVDVTVSDKTFNTQILVDGGYFMFQWNLVGEQSGAPLTCESAGLAGGRPRGIQLQAFVANSTESSIDIFDCEDGYGVTAGYVEGAYDVNIDAVDPDLVGSAAPIRATIEAPNKVTNLGTVTIPIGL